MNSVKFAAQAEAVHSHEYESTTSTLVDAQSSRKADIAYPHFWHILSVLIPNVMVYLSHTTQ